MVNLRPWKDVTLCSVLVEICRACPDLIPLVFMPLQKFWEFQDDETWHASADLVLTILENIDADTIGRKVPDDKEIVVDIKRHVIAPYHLLMPVIKTCCRQSTSSTVFAKCCQILSVGFTNMQSFSSSLTPELSSCVQAAALKYYKKLLNPNELWSRVC